MKGVQGGFFLEKKPLKRVLPAYSNSKNAIALNMLDDRQPLDRWIMQIDQPLLADPWGSLLEGRAGVALLVTPCGGAGLAAPGRVFWKRMIESISGRKLSAGRPVH
jgi:uncharacterized iron-regulated membrane protein